MWNAYVRVQYAYRLPVRRPRSLLKPLPRFIATHLPLESQIDVAATVPLGARALDSIGRHEFQVTDCK